MSVLDNDTRATDPVIRDRTGTLAVHLDPESGFPAAVGLRRDDHEEAFPLAVDAVLEIGGDEQYRQPRGFEYVNTERITGFRRVDEPVSCQDNGPDTIHTVTTTAGKWTLTWEYTFRQRHPRIGLDILVTPPSEDGDFLLRNVWLDIVFAPQDLGTWSLEAPGNQFRPGVRADSVHEPVSVSTAGGTRGSAGLMAVHRTSPPGVLVVWPLSRTEIGSQTIQSVDGCLRMSLETGLAGHVRSGTALRYGTVAIDVVAGSWPDVRGMVPDWYVSTGIAAPRDRAPWIDTTSIFEVQIGHSVFRGGWEYGPYQTVRDLIDDLGRIRGLGFDCLQIMPRQPYPSYNVHDYRDITTSYGNEADLRELVDLCHTLGMRVILDILMHGVIDQEVIAETAERVRTGPWFERLDESMASPFAAYAAASEAMQIAWCRHILDFEPHWAGGSPPRHPLADEHPEWFMRNSAGEIIGIYTKAFDVANTAWQEYFMATAEDLVRRLDIDGFRFDAPTYNALPNWSPTTRHRASYSPLGVLELFQRLRPRLKALKPDIMLYTEPSGVLFRESMDLNYNYDEQWLIEAVLRPGDDHLSEEVAVRHGRDLAAWFRDRDATLPRGSLIAHHIDSHDTFWWPLPGKKWRREQYGLDAARALLAVFALSGGAYMTFVGGEAGLEDELRRMHRLRRDLPEIARGNTDYNAVAVDRDEVYAIVRRHLDQRSLLAVNLSDQPVTARLSLDMNGVGEFTAFDMWNQHAIRSGGRYAFPGETSADMELDFAPFQPRLVALRPVGKVRKGELAAVGT